MKASRLLAIDPASLRVVASVVPAPQASRADGQVQAVYGLTVDDARSQIWTTNTRSGSVAVYREADLSLVRQFPDNVTPHARDVRSCHASHHRAYVSSPASNVIHVFDSATLQPLPGITLTGAARRPKPMSLALDADHQRLYTVSLNTAEVFAIDTATGRQVARHTVPGVQGASGIAVDSQTQQIYVAAQKIGRSDGAGRPERPGPAAPGDRGRRTERRLRSGPPPCLRRQPRRGHRHRRGRTRHDPGPGRHRIRPEPHRTGPKGQRLGVMVKKSKDDPRGDRLVRIEARR